MRVFIRSSRQSIPIMEQVAICIERCGHCPIRWDDENAFLPGEYTHETLARLASQVDAALFIFAGDDKVWYHESTSLQPRDNVLVEYGLFSGTLGRKSVIICRCQSAKIASDLLGINYIEYSEHTNIFTRYLRRWFDSISSKAMESVPPLFYDTSGNPLFAQEVKTLVKRAKHIFMMGMGLDILSNLSLVDELLDRSLSGSCTVAVYVGDPYNPTIESRLIEEERGDKAPWVKKAGLISRLRKLLLDWDRAGRPNSFSVKVFTNYPTFALLVFDEDYFIYPYAYSMLGNFSPVMRFAESNPQHQQIVHFLRKQKEAIERDAIDAFSEYHVRNHKSSGVFRQLASTLDNNALAVYFIPPKDSLLYEAGSLIVGYDVRESTPVVSPWGGYQGDACFYVTVH